MELWSQDLKLYFWLATIVFSKSGRRNAYELDMVFFIVIVPILLILLLKIALFNSLSWFR